MPILKLVSPLIIVTLRLVHTHTHIHTHTHMVSVYFRHIKFQTTHIWNNNSWDVLIWNLKLSNIRISILVNKFPISNLLHLQNLDFESNFQLARLTEFWVCQLSLFQVWVFWNFTLRKYTLTHKLHLYLHGMRTTEVGNTQMCTAQSCTSIYCTWVVQLSCTICVWTLLKKVVCVPYDLLL